MWQIVAMAKKIAIVEDEAAIRDNYAAAFAREGYKVDVLTWIHSGTFEADWTIRVDPLSAVMMFVVSTVSTLIHIYSIGYMSHDPHVPRFMAYLSLFTFFMLVLPAGLTVYILANTFLSIAQQYYIRKVVMPKESTIPAPAAAAATAGGAQASASGTTSKSGGGGKGGRRQSRRRKRKR